MKAKGYLTDDERKALVYLAGRVPNDGLMVNIGVQYGASVICLLAGRRNHRIKIEAVDIDPRPWNGQRYPPFPNVYMHLADSGALALVWDRPVDLLFVDGDHSYEGVKRDLAWTEHLKEGGHVIFHDCYNWPPDPPKTTRSVCPEVNHAVSEWYEKGNEWYEEREAVDSMRIFKKVS